MPQDLLSRYVDRDILGHQQAILRKLTELLEIAKRKEERETEIVFFNINEDGTERQFSIGTTEIDFMQGTLINPDGSKEYLSTSLSLQHRDALHSISIDANTDCVLQLENYPKRYITAGYSTQIPWVTFTKIKITCTALTDIQVFCCTNPAAVIGQFKYSMITNIETGTATIPAGDTYVDVTHGVSSTPTFVSVEAQDEYGIDRYISSIGATTFRINIQVAQDTDAVFMWGATA